MDIKEIGRIRNLLRDLNEPAETMQECDRKRVVILQLGDLGDESAVHPLLDFIDQDIYSATAISAIGKLKYVHLKDRDMFGIIDKLADKVENGSSRESANAMQTLKRIAQQKIDSSEVVDKVMSVLKNNGSNNTELRSRVIEAIKSARELNTKKFKPPEKGNRIKQKTKHHTR